MHDSRWGGRFVPGTLRRPVLHVPVSGDRNSGHYRLHQNRKAGALHTVLVAMALVASLVPAGIAPVAAAQPACRAFGEFAVCARFLDEWSKQGSDQAGVYVNGLPITGRRPELSVTDGKLYDTQWFERARYEAHPENSSPYDVLLGLLGTGLAEGRGQVDPSTGVVRNPADLPFAGIGQPADANTSGKLWFPETRHSVSGKIMEYWNRYGGLRQFGFPLSEPFQEVSEADGKLYTVQYFERNRFELHPEKQAPYEVELGLLGVQQYKMAPVAADQLPVAPPKGVVSKRDTVIIASVNEPTDLIFDTISATPMTQGLMDVAPIGYDENQREFPWGIWYIPTIENGGAFYAGTGDDRQLVVKYKLRPGIRFSDGVELTSKDYAFWYEYYMRPDYPSNKTNLLKLANVDNPDKYTVMLRFMSYRQAQAFYNKLPDKENYDFIKYFVDRKQPAVDSTYFTYISYLPEHIFKNVPEDKIPDSPYASESYVGTGPYRIERWTKGREMVLVQNDNYTLTDKPLIKRVVIRFNKDRDEIVKQLQAGDVDIALGNVFPVPTGDANTLGSDIAVDVQPADFWEHLDFNFSYAPFKEKAVREAIITAINRQKIVDGALEGKSVVLNTVAAPTLWWSLENPDFAKHYPDAAAKWKLPVYAYDPAAANRLLDAAGWLRGPDGVRAKGGVRLEVELASTVGAKLRSISTRLIQSDLQAVGIKANLQYYTSKEYFGWNGAIDRGQCQLCEFAWSTGPYADLHIWSSVYIPSAEHPEGDNMTHYANPRIDQIADLLNSDVDRRVLAEYAAEGQVAMMRDVAIIPLLARPVTIVHKKSLSNIKMDFLGDIWWKAAAWYFDR